MGIETRVAALTAFATVASSTVVRAKRTEELARRQGLKGTRLLPDGQGGHVEYLLTGNPSSTEPVIVCENGLGEPLEGWDWVEFFLREDYRILRYHRSRYGRTTSSLRPGQLIELLLRALAPEHPVAYVGHSIGSLVMSNAVRESAHLRARVRSITIIDGTDPDLLETDRSSATKAAKFRQVTRQRRLAGTIGFNWWGPDMMARQVAYRPDVQNAYRLFISDSATLRTATTEYTTEPLTGLTDPEGLPVNRHVFGAADNVIQQSRLAEKLRADLSIIPGSGHRSILGYPEHALYLTRLLRERTTA
ncbi:alpha/beta hydrolase [Kocuria sp. CPCC 205268]|uniref:alpha/beta hydrolase n=1 Tax=Kocuria oxytropis TaxID=3058913 RepID=UPI0034D56725